LPIVPLDNERALLARMQEGDEAAFREVFNGYYPNIYGVALAFTKSPELAEEIVQDVFVKIWMKRDTLDEIERFDSYLFITARNHILNTLRKKVREVQFSEEILNYYDLRDSPESKLLAKESVRIIGEAIQHLPNQQRKVYRMSREQGMNHEEIARSLGISKNTVKVHMQKALGSIREYLEKNAGDLLFLICLLETWL